MAKFFLEIITPDRQAFSSEVDIVTVPTERGQIGVLPHHVALFTVLTDGEIKITSANKEYFLAIGGGFMEVARNRVSILVSRAVHAHELNMEEIRRAQAKAKETLTSNLKGQDQATAQALLRRSILDMKVLLRRHRTGAPTISDTF